jgi:hypothetical protein
VVLHLSARHAGELIDPRKPELALCAAWAMQNRHGAAAQRLVERAIDVSDHLPAPLQQVQLRAIFDVLSDRMRSRLREEAMRPDDLPQNPAARKLWLSIEARGVKRARAEVEAGATRRALLIMLRGRGLSITTAARARINACDDAALLDKWLKRAGTAETVAELLGPEPTAKTQPVAKAKPAMKPAPRRRPAARRNTRPARKASNGARSSARSSKA